MEQPPPGSASSSAELKLHTTSPKTVDIPQKVIRLQIDAGEPFRFLIVTDPRKQIGDLIRQIEEDFSDLYERHFKARLQVSRLQDSHNNDMPNRLCCGDLLKDMDKVYVLIKNLQLPPPEVSIGLASAGLTGLGLGTGMSTNIGMNIGGPSQEYFGGREKKGGESFYQEYSPSFSPVVSKRVRDVERDRGRELMEHERVHERQSESGSELPPKFMLPSLPSTSYPSPSHEHNKRMIFEGPPHLTSHNRAPIEENPAPAIPILLPSFAVPPGSHYLPNKD
jgi:hypothetical protein